jgi:DNA (cytosine-5)-methyltransferase 1
MVNQLIDNQTIIATSRCDDTANRPLISSYDSSHAKVSDYSVVSLFSGCGGMDLGFQGNFSIFGRHYAKNPFQIAWANEINAAACNTYRRNIDKKIHHGDIQDFLATLPSSADVIIGGFPCQDISINGKGLGINGKRSSLYTSMIEAIAFVKPKVFVAENVKGLLLQSRKASFDKIMEDFDSLGYNVSYALYHAADYGVPQSRERVFIVGTAKGIPTFMPPKPERTKENWMTATEAISDLESLEVDESINHVWSAANASHDQGNRRLDANRPGFTIRAECHGNIQFHYSLPRRISMREAARIQSFPDNFIFASKLRETERQVGNAVPPVLAWHIAQAIKDCLHY